MLVTAEVFTSAPHRFKELNRAFAAHQIHPLVDKVFEFEHLRDAYEYQESQQHVGKVVVKVSKD